ncbi:MAG: septal ring lytic transglycosylase RlpA family protein [Methyloceanibacter sp.]
MRRVAGALPLNASAMTWAAALGVVAVSVLCSLTVAERIVALQEPAPRLAVAAPEPVQTSNRAKKAAREPMRQQARLVPELPLPQPVAAALPAAGPAAPAPQADAAPAATEPAFRETGRASWYQLPSPTANGERMQEGALTAAHPFLPFGAHVKVANLDNGREVVVRINDRGPFAKNRIIDVSKAAAAKLGMVRAGVARVKVSLMETELASAGETDGETLR